MEQAVRFRSIAARAFIASLLIASACTQRIEVLGAGPRDAYDAGGTPFDAAGRADAAADACGACASAQLCAIDRCVATLGIRSLDAHLDHTCIVRDARAFCWGDNARGQLGVGDREPRLSPARIGADTDWLLISTGEQHSCGIRAPGDLYCWGLNHVGQLGVGDTEDRELPARVAGDALWVAVDCGGASCCAIDHDALLHCWGDNSEGKVGQIDGPSAPDALLPTRVDDARWQRVTVGQGHVCAIREDGGLHCWGRNSGVELGIGPQPIQARGPRRVGEEADWIDITASQHSSCGLRAQGELWCWGRDTHHELGGDALDELIDRPRAIASGIEWRSVHVGWFHTCARSADESLFCWGRAIEGQLGQGGGEQPVQQPTRVTSAEGFGQVALGRFYTCGVAADGTLQCWGENHRGQLGTGDTERRYDPATIP